MTERKPPKSPDDLDQRLSQFRNERDIATGRAKKEVSTNNGLGFAMRIGIELVAALGIGLASTIHGRDPLIDGFGLIAFASLTPMIFVMAYGMLI